MKNHNSVLKFFPLALGATFLIIGCESKPKTDEPAYRESTLRDPAVPTATEVAFARMAASGARDDAMLFSQHFDDGKLNSLGRDKIDRILSVLPKGATARLYINLPEGDTTDALMIATEDYLADAGIAPEKIFVGQGTNPGALRDTTDSIAARKALRDGGASSDQGPSSIGVGIDIGK